MLTQEEKLEHKLGNSLVLKLVFWVAYPFICVLRLIPNDTELKGADKFLKRLNKKGKK